MPSSLMNNSQLIGNLAKTPYIFSKRSGTGR